MNVIVLNGSPKGELSCTLQYIRYLQKKFPQHVFKVLPIAQQIQKLERDTRAFGEVMDEIRGADAVFWAVIPWQAARKPAPQTPRPSCSRAAWRS